MSLPFPTCGRNSVDDQRSLVPVDYVCCDDAVVTAAAGFSVLETRRSAVPETIDWAEKKNIRNQLADG